MIFGIGKGGIGGLAGLGILKEIVKSGNQGVKDSVGGNPPRFSTPNLPDINDAAGTGHMEEGAPSKDPDKIEERPPTFETPQPPATRIDPDKLVASLEKIHTGIINYLGTIEKNTETGFAFVDKELKGIKDSIDDIDERTTRVEKKTATAISRFDRELRDLRNKFSLGKKSDNLIPDRPGEVVRVENKSSGIGLADVMKYLLSAEAITLLAGPLLLAMTLGIEGIAAGVMSKLVVDTVEGELRKLGLDWRVRDPKKYSDPKLQKNIEDIRKQQDDYIKNNKSTPEEEDRLYNMRRHNRDLLHRPHVDQRQQPKTGGRGPATATPMLGALSWMMGTKHGGPSDSVGGPAPGNQATIQAPLPNMPQYQPIPQGGPGRFAPVGGSSGIGVSEGYGSNYYGPQGMPQGGSLSGHDLIASMRAITYSMGGASGGGGGGGGGFSAGGVIGQALGTAAGGGALGGMVGRYLGNRFGGGGGRGAGGGYNGPVIQQKGEPGLNLQGLKPELAKSLIEGSKIAFGDPSDPKTRYVLTTGGGGGVGLGRGGTSFHNRGLAVDVQIYDRQTKAFVGGSGDIMKNAFGNPQTYRIYEALAQAQYQYNLKTYGKEEADKYSWGGRFGSSHQGTGPDEMHFSYGEGGNLGPITGPVANKQAGAAMLRQGAQSEGMGPDPAAWKSPFAVQIDGSPASTSTSTSQQEQPKETRTPQGYSWAPNIPKKLRDDITSGGGKFNHYPGTVSTFGGQEGAALVNAMRQSLTPAHYQEWESTGILDPSKLTDDEYNKLSKVDPKIASLVTRNPDRVENARPGTSPAQERQRGADIGGTVQGRSAVVAPTAAGWTGPALEPKTGGTRNKGMPLIGKRDEAQSEVLRLDRAGLKAEYDRMSPDEKRILHTRMYAENDKDPAAVAEAMLNRIAINRRIGKSARSTLTGELNSAFWGSPGRWPAIQAYLKAHPDQEARVAADVEYALGGSNRLRGYADQGGPGGRGHPDDPNYWRAKIFGRTGDEGYGPWPAEDPNFEKYRQEQQARVAAGGAIGETSAASAAAGGGFDINTDVPAKSGRRPSYIPDAGRAPAGQLMPSPTIVKTAEHIRNDAYPWTKFRPGGPQTSARGLIGGRDTTDKGPTGGIGMLGGPGGQLSHGGLRRMEAGPTGPGAIMNPEMIAPASKQTWGEWFTSQLHAHMPSLHGHLASTAVPQGSESTFATMSTSHFKAQWRRYGMDPANHPSAPMGHGAVREQYTGHPGIDISKVASSQNTNTVAPHSVVRKEATPPPPSPGKTPGSNSVVRNPNYKEKEFIHTPRRGAPHGDTSGKISPNPQHNNDGPAGPGTGGAVDQTNPGVGNNGSGNQPSRTGAGLCAV